jgi:hypothetical protein
VRLTTRVNGYLLTSGAETLIVYLLYGKVCTRTATSKATSTPVQPFQHHHTLVLTKTLVRILIPLSCELQLILTALYPFHRSTAGDFWTSATVRDHTVFGSTYPEFLGLSATNTLTARVNALYGPNATSQFSWETARIDQHIASPQSGDAQYQYFANIRAQHTGPGGVTKVFVFLGGDMSVNTESPDPLHWMADPTFVGYTGFQGAAGQESGVAHEMGMQTKGVVALTKALENHLRRNDLESMDEAAVGAYLQEKLIWKLVGVSPQSCMPHCWSRHVTNPVSGQRRSNRPCKCTRFRS